MCAVGRAIYRAALQFLRRSVVIAVRGAQLPHPLLPHHAPQLAPFTVGYGQGWSTNWQLQGQAIKTGDTGKVGVFRDSSGNANIFQNPTQASAAFRFALPGESGQRNNFRGPGYLELDNGLYKTWKLTEGQSVKFSWEAFNVTNTPRFDAAYSASLFTVQFVQFCRYADTLSKPRVMQFALRYDF